MKTFARALSAALTAASLAYLSLAAPRLMRERCNSDSGGELHE